MEGEVRKRGEETPPSARFLTSPFGQISVGRALGRPLDSLKPWGEVMYHFICNLCIILYVMMGLSFGPLENPAFL